VKARDIESARRKGLKMYRFEGGKRIQYEPPLFAAHL